MAVITQLNQNDQDQQKQQAGQQPGVSPVTPVGGSQSANIPSTGQSGTGTGAAVANNTPAASGNFTNLQNYLNANKGAGANIATKIGQGVQQSADKTNKDVAATGAIQSQLDAEKNRLAQASSFATQIGQDPTQLANNNDTVNAITQLRSGTNAADTINSAAQTKLNAAQNDLKTLQQNAANTATENGRFQLLQQTLGRPTYNTGQQSLDNLLVQNGGQGVLDNLQKTAQTTANNATNTLGQTSAQLSTGVNDVKSQAAAAQAAINGAIGSLDNAGTSAYDGTGALGALQQSLQKRQQDYINQQNGLVNGYTSGVGSNSFNSSVLNALGLNNGENLYDVDLNNYVKPMTLDKSNVSEQSVATNDDLTRYNALAKLAGVDPSYLNSSQIGTAATPITDAQKQALQSAINSAHDVYTNRQNDMNNLFNSLASDPANGGSNYISGVSSIFGNGKPYDQQTVANNILNNSSVQQAGSYQSQRINDYYNNLLKWARQYNQLTPVLNRTVTESDRPDNTFGVS